MVFLPSATTAKDVADICGISEGVARAVITKARSNDLSAVLNYYFNDSENLKQLPPMGEAEAAGAGPGSGSGQPD